MIYKCADTSFAGASQIVNSWGDDFDVNALLAENSAAAMGSLTTPAGMEFMEIEASSTSGPAASSSAGAMEEEEPQEESAFFIDVSKERVSVVHECGY